VLGWLGKNDKFVKPGLGTFPHPDIPTTAGFSSDVTNRGERRKGDFPGICAIRKIELKIKGDLIPEAAAEEIIGELQALFARHNAGAALSAKAVFKPTKEFHTARHTLYSADENMEIDKVVPVAASVKTKLGRGGTGED
jgi:hypothetical protein